MRGPHGTAGGEPVSAQESRQPLVTTLPDPAASIDPFSAGRDRLLLIAGPCVIESEEHTLRMAEAIKAIAGRAGFPCIFKASYDKANRTSLASYRGPGLDAGLRVLERVRLDVGLPVLTDFHEPGQAAAVAEAADVLQVPAFLSRQTDLIVAAARTGRIVNIKKAQFMAPWDIEFSINKAREAGAERIWVTERGVCFGYNNLVSDMRSLVVMARYGCPVIYDATHSIQIPSGAGGKSGGERQYLEPLLRAAVAVGVDGVFMEVHDDPDRALCDGPNQLPLDRLLDVLETIRRIDAARRGDT
ncbi:MAG: 2-dehydro-3-deoxyphosphooctonate aldolase [candidate division BRC1 bacterium ADurb.BinA292]|nr:MAG: 2-dehydro-3-deoxyphosphooctonate aldolase [candidate division BRC1 bacterium ADurb.BinA292]